MQDDPLKSSRSGKLPHDLPLDRLADWLAQADRAAARIAADPALDDNPDFDGLMARISGGITLSEARFLAATAAGIAADGPAGALIEVGSFRGKSSVALSMGARAHGPDRQRVLHCIEPHRPFKGAFSGNFGPPDRAQFMAAMLATGSCANTALINLSSDELAPEWPGDVALCFIDGDHRYEGVRRDFELWSPRIVRGGLLIFDDAVLEKAGPTRLVREILAAGGWEALDAPGKFRALRKLGPAARVAAPGRNLLVLCEEMVFTGGLIRFRKLAQALAPWGHQLSFLPLSGTAPDTPDQWPGTRIIDREIAAARRWDAVMVPGAGFNPETIAALTDFTDPRYGLRVQHLLNDQSRRDGFAAVNATFRPDLLLSNTPDWREANLAGFTYTRFDHLIGALDTTFFAPAPSHLPLSGETVTLGGQAGKNPLPLVAALRRLPPNVHLRLFGKPPKQLLTKAADLIEAGRIDCVGPLDDAGLRDFYHHCDAVISTEKSAGWANMPAEAAACGIPLITTHPGTAAFADETTALLLDDPVARPIALAVKTLMNDPAAASARATRARAAIAPFTWTRYAATLLDMIDTTARATS